MGDQRHPEALRVALVVDRVVPVVVRVEDVRDGDVVPLDPLQQGIDDAVAVDEDAVPTGPVGDEVGVREPGRVLGALDDHGLQGARRACRT